MPVSGLILTLADDPARADAALADLVCDDRFDLGTRSGLRQPVTLTTDDRGEDRACWDWLQSHSDIDFVDVVCVFFDDAEPGSEDHNPALTPTDTARSRTW